MNSTDSDYDYPEVDSHGIYAAPEEGEYNPDDDPDWGKRRMNITAEVEAVMEYGIIGGAR